MHVIDRFSTGVAGLAVLLGGCSSGSSRVEDTAESAAAATVANGMFCNGTRVNGVQLAPLRIDDLRLRGRPLGTVSIRGASLSVASPRGAPMSAGELAGAELAATLANGTAVTLRIDGVTAGNEQDVQRYAVSLRVDRSRRSQPLCGAAADGTPVLAIPLAGAWDESEDTPTGGAHLDDPGVFTFACEGYALAKCVELGYAPWRRVSECDGRGTCAARSLAPFHQACTRMVRADYCGDGTSTTRDGTLVDVWDHFGIQTDDAPAWSLEAEWSPGGAVCVEETRWATIASDGVDVQGYIRDHCPSRWKAPGCGGAGSTFFTANGFDVPLAARSLLRTRLADPR